MQDAKQTPLYGSHLRHGGKMVAYGGWMLPVQYSTILKEHAAVREGAGVFDVSHMGEVLVSGSGAPAYLNQLLTNDFTGMAVGRCRYSPMCYEDGGTVDDVIVYKRGEDRYLVIVNAANTQKDFDWMQRHAAHFEDLTVQNVSDDYAQIALQGPGYRDVLEKAGVSGGVLPVKPYTFVEPIDVAGVRCLVSTTGYTGEAGVELYCAPMEAERLHDALIRAGAEPCGLGARDTLRFEASMPLYGHELDKDITPMEAGLASFVKFEKPDFIGKKALQAPPARRRIGLEIIDRGIAREDCPVLDAHGNPVGETTSGGFAPTVGKNLAMAIVRADAADADTFLVQVRGRSLAARRIPLPFYKAASK